MQTAMEIPGHNLRVPFIQSLSEKIGDNISFYILCIIAIIWPLGMFLLSLSSLCYYHQTFYSPYGNRTEIQLIPEMVLILAFLTALVIFLQLILILGIRKKNKLNNPSN